MRTSEILRDAALVAAPISSPRITDSPREAIDAIAGVAGPDSAAKFRALRFVATVTRYRVREILEDASRLAAEAGE